MKKRQHLFAVALICAACACAQAQQRSGPSRTPARGAEADYDKELDRLFDAGDRLEDDGKWDEAVKLYRRATELRPKSSDAFVRLGDAYMGAGKWIEARAAYQQATALDDRNADAFYALGRAYNDMGEHGNAFKPLVRAIQLDPEFAEAHYGIGYAYLYTDQYERAIPFLRSALRLKPDYAEAVYALALVYAHLGNSPALEEQRGRLAALDPSLSKELERELRDLGTQLGAAGGRTEKPPIRKKALLDALKINGLTTNELVKFVRERGVDFRMSAEDEEELRAAGARPALIEAVRSGYRARGATPPE